MKHHKQLPLLFLCPSCKQELPGYMKKAQEKVCLDCMEGGFEKNKSYLLYNKFARVVKPEFIKDTLLNRKIKLLFAHRIRSRLKDFFKSKGIKKKVNRWIGCDLETFKKYIESKFDSEMTWENYGFKGWHIDHIKPISKFNLNDDNEVAKINHYTNLQPLWDTDNYAKTNKYDQST